jgi:transcriptional regulator with XRE-family HTH domain
MSRTASTAVPLSTPHCSGCAHAMLVVQRSGTRSICGMCGQEYLPASDLGSAPAPADAGGPPDASVFTPEMNADGTPGECPGCIEARAYLQRMRDTRSRHAESTEENPARKELVRLPRCRNGWVYCEVCTQPNGEPTIVSLDERGEQAALDATTRRIEQAEARLERKKMFDEFENLARYRSYLEGKGTEPSPIVGDGNRGGGAKLSAIDRPDYLDKAVDEGLLQRAMETASKLDGLLSAARIHRYQRESLRTTTGSRLRAMREQLGMSRETLAEAVMRADDDDGILHPWLDLDADANAANTLALRLSFEDPGLRLLHWLRRFVDLRSFYVRWVRALEDTAGFTIAPPTLRALAKVFHRDEDDLHDRLTHDDTPPPTDLERGVAVLHWLSIHVGPGQRKGIVMAIGEAFGGRAAAEDLQARRSELTRRRHIVAMNPEVAAAERKRIADETVRAVEKLRAEREAAIAELAQLRRSLDPRADQWTEIRFTSIDTAMSQVFVQRLKEMNDLEARIAEGRRALTPEQFRAAIARLPPAPTTEAVKVMGAELLALAEAAWRGE